MRFWLLLRQEINAIAAKTIVNSMVTEITNDVKKVLCHEPTRLHLPLVVARELEALPRGRGVRKKR
jgi:hypothetical protein